MIRGLVFDRVGVLLDLEARLGCGSRVPIVDFNSPYSFNSVNGDGFDSRKSSFSSRVETAEV